VPKIDIAGPLYQINFLSDYLLKNSRKLKDMKLHQTTFRTHLTHFFVAAVPQLPLYHAALLHKTASLRLCRKRKTEKNAS
jgi:hypothetical protein